MYLGNSLYRIHGTNAPETIGTKVSSGCIRLINADVIDLFNRVSVGTKVVVLTATVIGEELDNDNNKKLAPYNEFLRSLAKERKAPLADLYGMFESAIKATPNTTGKPGRLLTSDGVHMSPPGDQLMARGVLQAFGLDAAQLKAFSAQLGEHREAAEVFGVRARDHALRELKRQLNKQSTQSAAGLVDTLVKDAAKVGDVSIVTSLVDATGTVRLHYRRAINDVTGLFVESNAVQQIVAPRTLDQTLTTLIESVAMLFAISVVTTAMSTFVSRCWIASSTSGSVTTHGDSCGFCPGASPAWWSS